MKRIHHFICLAFLFLSVASCREEDPLSAAGDATPLRLCVVADNFVSTGAATRATEEGYITRFAADDRIGVFAVSATAGVLDKNIPYKYSGTAWVPVDAANTVHRYDNYLDDVTYFAYYPYSADMDGKKSEQEIIDAFTPQADQSTYVNYTASDLMTGTGTLTGTAEGGYTLTLQLKHRMTLLVLCPDRHTNYRAPAGAGYEYHPESGIKSAITNAKINNAAPYAVGDDTYRLIVKPGTMNVPLEYTLGATTTSHTFTGLALTAGTYRRFNLGHDASATIERSLKVGDFYYYDGTNAYLIPGDDTLTPEQQAACIGIVYSTDVNRIGDRARQALNGKGITTPNGLVMALTNASEGCKWGAAKDENSSGIDGEPFKINTDKALRQENIDGYGETQWMITNHSTELQYYYQVFYHASRYGKIDESSRYAVPSDKTTGWFVPSIGQWWDIQSNLGGIDPSVSDVAQAALNNLNKYLNKISGAMLFQMNTGFWSSSESSTYAAHAIYFYHMGDFFESINKSYDDRKVRCCFAF